MHVQTLGAMPLFHSTLPADPQLFNTRATMNLGQFHETQQQRDKLVLWGTLAMFAVLGVSVYAWARYAS